MVFGGLACRITLARLFGIGAIFGLFVTSLPAAELADAWAKLRTGEYEDALAAADAGRKAEPREEGYWRVEIEALLALGRYDEAADLVQSGLRSSMRDSLRIRLIGVEAARLAGEAETAERLLQELNFLVKTRRTSAREVDRVVALGEAALLLGAEPRLVLDNFLKRGRESKPPVRDAFLATGRLALSKRDYALASRTFQQGLAAFPDDPDLWAGIAAAFIDGDRTKLVEYAEKALELNEHHAAARLLLAENQIDSEQFAEADKEIDRVLAVNPRSPEAHALRAVLAQLRHDLPAAAAARAEALAPWANNPRVDYVIGRKLAQRQFHEQAAIALRRALAFDPTFAPARIELAQALLRSGREAEGWTLADAAARRRRLRRDRLQPRQPARSAREVHHPHDAEFRAAHGRRRSADLWRPRARPARTRPRVPHGKIRRHARPADGGGDFPQPEGFFRAHVRPPGRTAGVSRRVFRSVGHGQQSVVEAGELGGRAVA